MQTKILWTTVQKQLSVTFCSWLSVVVGPACCMACGRGGCTYQQLQEYAAYADCSISECFLIKESPVVKSTVEAYQRFAATNWL